MTMNINPKILSLALSVSSIPSDAPFFQWNSHIHCLVTKGGFSDDSFWRNVKHFNYTFLHNAFQTALLNEMEKRIGPSFKKTKALSWAHPTI